MIKLREYEEKDFNDVCNLFYNTIHKVNKKDYSKEQLDKWAPVDNDYIKLADKLNSSYSYVALIDDVIVGFGSIKDNYLDLLYVDSNYTGKNIGSILLEKLETHANNTITVHASITAKSFFLKHKYFVISSNEVNIDNVILVNYLMKKYIK